MTQNNKVVAVVSGGLDSVVMLNSLVKEGKEVLVLNFSYGSKHNVAERRCLRRVCSQLQVSLFTYDLPPDCQHQEGFIPDPEGCGNDIVGTSFAPLLKSDLLVTGDDVPDGHYEDQSMRQTVVPFRNGIMLAIAVGFAESYGASQVAYACHAGDHTIYPDCRLEFADAMEEAAKIGTYSSISIDTPFVQMTKFAIVVQGLKEGAPLELTWSCYRGGAENGRPCLKCSTCVERTEAFLLAETPDPALSADEWETAVEEYKAAAGRRER